MVLLWTQIEGLANLTQRQIVHSCALWIRISMQRFIWLIKNSPRKMCQSCLCSICDPLICKWINSKCHSLVISSFDKFITVLMSNFLSSAWMDDLVQDLLNCSMDKDQCFSNWVYYTKILNSYLKGYPEHYDDTKFHIFLWHKMDKNLYNCLDNSFNDLKDLHSWVKTV